MMTFSTSLAMECPFPSSPHDPSLLTPRVTTLELQVLEHAAAAPRLAWQTEMDHIFIHRPPPIWLGAGVHLNFRNFFQRCPF